MADNETIKIVSLLNFAFFYFVLTQNGIAATRVGKDTNSLLIMYWTSR